MAELDPFLTRGQALGPGRYDGHPDAFGSKTGIPAPPAPPRMPTRQPGLYGSSTPGLTSDAFSTGRAEFLVEQVRQKLHREHPEPPADLPPPPQVLRFHAPSVAVLVFVPWAVFVVVTGIFALTSPASFGSWTGYVLAVIFTTLACLLLHVYIALLRIPIYLYLGLLCLLAVASGCMAGHILYEREVAEHWLQLMQTSHSNVAPTQSAAALSDAASLAFTEATRVDLRRVLGFRPPEEGLTYCVAPILDDTQLSRVEFWAAGIDCCEPLWGFYCDDALKPGTRSGLVLSSAASSFTARRNARFQEAARQAAALYDLETPEQPVFLRWLEDPNSVKFALRDGAVGWLLFSILYLMASVFLAAVLHVANAGQVTSPTRQPLTASAPSTPKSVVGSPNPF